MTHHPETITPGRLVAVESRKLNGRCVTVLPDTVLDRATVDRSVQDAGWQFAEYDHTHARVLVRLTDEHKWVGNLRVRRVDVAHVETVAVPYGDTFSIVAAVGAARPQGWTRTENVRTPR